MFCIARTKGVLTKKENNKKLLPLSWQEYENLLKQGCNPFGLVIVCDPVAVQLVQSQSTQNSDHSTRGGHIGGDFWPAIIKIGHRQHPLKF